MFEMLSTGPRIGLFAFAALLMTAGTMGLKWTYGVLNGKVMEGLRAEQEKKKGRLVERERSR